MSKLLSLPISAIVLCTSIAALGQAADENAAMTQVLEAAEAVGGLAEIGAIQRMHLNDTA